MVVHDRAEAWALADRLMILLDGRLAATGSPRDLLEQLASPAREVIEYAGAHRTLEFEPNPDLFVDDLLRWLERRTAAHKPPG